MNNLLNDEEEENLNNFISTKLASISAEDYEKLKAYLLKLKNLLDEEKSNSKQAAEYGLSLLEDSKKLQSRIYELEGEIETYKAELESTNLVYIYYKLDLVIFLIILFRHFRK